MKKSLIFISALVAVAAAAVLLAFTRHTLPANSQLAYAARTRTILTTGDVMLGRYINYETTTKHDFAFPFAKTAEKLKRADLVFINLEGPLVNNCPRTTQGMIFCADTRSTAGLQAAGIDVANLANNHAANYGTAGITDTKNALEKAGIGITGLGQPVMKDVRGLRFGFLGYNDVGKLNGIAAADEAQIKSDIMQLKKQADIVLVAFHWGIEYTAKPTTRQQHLAHLAIDAGADAIIGNHPHWVQPLETYKGKPIIYSHGNFVFDQFWSPETQRGIVTRFTFTDKNLTNVELLPVTINKQGQPSF